jgi:cysteine synthase/rhodanese-related sulfurtransferase
MNNLNVFSGKNAMLDFLNPDNNPPIPMVELSDALNPFRKEGVRIYAKLMNTLPLNNVKSLPSYNMLMEAKERGDLDNIDTVIENSSGNTVFSLAVVGRLLGIPHTKAVVSNEVSSGKLKMLRLFGTEVIVNKEPICPDPSDKTSGIYKAKVWANENGWLNAGQYDNFDNPKAHEKWTGKQIWEQTEGNISVFCAGLGTTGTMVGVGRYLKSQNSNIKNIGVARLSNNPVPGPRTKNLLREIAFDWENIVDEVEEVGTIDSYKTSIDLCRYGLLVGPSSGFALRGLFNYLSKAKEQNKLSELKNENGEIICVFIACDSPFPYLNEYFEYLDEDLFPEVENEELLNNEIQVNKKMQFSDVSEYEITVDEAFKESFEDNPKKVWNQLLNDGTAKVKENIVIVDTRNKDDFEHFHIPNAMNIDYLELENNTGKYLSALRDKKVIAICYRGNTSKLATSILRNSNIEAYTVKGGMTEWSAKNLPRWRPDICKVNMPITTTL